MLCNLSAGLRLTFGWEQEKEMLVPNWMNCGSQDTTSSTYQMRTPYLLES